ncbi:MAG: DNA primase DnaG [Candidatus Thermoplasmatota archaeon]|nr:DNA primase DnaG [Candidatus Thermoplasmatota archaeon]
MHIDPSTTKYLIRARISAEGVIEKPDVIGAIFGQTEGLLGDELDLRDLQKSARVGRIEVDIDSRKGRSEGEIQIPSSLDQVETAILAASLETIERVGPCKAKIDVVKIEDVRISKRNKIVERAKSLLSSLLEDARKGGAGLTETIREAVQIEEITTYGIDKCPSGPDVERADSVIVVEGRADVLNLLRAGIKNAIAVEGTNVPKTIQDLSKEKIVTVFVDGDRGGELLLKELLQTCEVDFITTAPKDTEVEEQTQKQIIKCLRNKMPTDQFIETYGLKIERVPKEEVKEVAEARTEERKRFFTILKPKKEPVPKVLSPIQLKYRELLAKLANTSKAQLVDSQGNIISEMLVRDLPDGVKAVPQSASAIVLDGVVTQRLVDTLSGSSVKTVIGVRIGNLTKLPFGIEVLTREDLE